MTGAVLQEFIDVLAVLNALRAAFPPKVVQDFDPGAAPPNEIHGLSPS
jgi:hypothetical protein